MNAESRLVDYFVVIGFDETKERTSLKVWTVLVVFRFKRNGYVLGNGISVGKILQRFPSEDWSDVPFFAGLEVVKNFYGCFVSAEDC